LVTLRTAVTDRTDLFAHQNRVRIVMVVVIATVNYMIAVALAAVAVALAVIIATLFKLEWVPDDADTLRVLGIGIGGILVLAFVIGIATALVRIPRARRTLEEQVLRETGASIADDGHHRELRNLLDGLAIAGGIPPPRFAVIEDAAPNSFGVGTSPEHAIVGVTTGLSHQLTRDELEAVLAYEVSRIRSWDVALASWTVALTGGAITALEDDDSGIGMIKAVVGWVPRRIAEWLQVWALRDQGRERDRAAVRFTRNPASLIRALEKLDADSSQITHVSRATAPLWIEFPASALGKAPSRVVKRLSASLLLDERIEALRKL
jgi:heat shock protein HtpX